MTLKLLLLCSLFLLTASQEDGDAGKETAEDDSASQPMSSEVDHFAYFVFALFSPHPSHFSGRPGFRGKRGKSNKLFRGCGWQSGYWTVGKGSKMGLVLVVWLQRVSSRPLRNCTPAMLSGFALLYHPESQLSMATQPNQPHQPILRRQLWIIALL